MSLNTAQLVCKQTLDGLDIPTLLSVVAPAFTQPLVAKIAMPPVDQPRGPEAYIWGPRGHEQRQTMPRSTVHPGVAGFKKVEYKMNIMVRCVLYPGNLNTTIMDSAFPALLNLIEQQFRDKPIPVFLTDPIDGVQYQLLEIGEEFDWDYGAPFALADQRIQEYRARIIMPLTEAAIG